MAHVAAVVEKKKLSDGQIAVCLRCCADATTDSWHTLSITAESTPADLTAWLDSRKAAVEALHQAHQDADAALQNLMV